MNEGKLKYTRTLGGHRRVHYETLEDLVKQNMHLVGEVEGAPAKAEQDLDFSAMLERRPEDLGQVPVTADVDDPSMAEYNAWVKQREEEKSNRDDSDPLGLDDL
jgi:hypothetical protein